MISPPNIRIALTALAIICSAVVVVLGAYTRLVDAGLGCPDWPTCYGHLWVPNSPAEIAVANENFATTPVEIDKTWPEQIHRIFATFLGMVMLTLFIVSYWRVRHFKYFLLLPALLLGIVSLLIARVTLGDSIESLMISLIGVYFMALMGIHFKVKQHILLNKLHDYRCFCLVALIMGLVILQGLFGMWTVTLNLWPQVVTAHLLGGFTILSLLCLLCSFYFRQDISTSQKDSILSAERKLSHLRPFVFFTIALVFMQIMMGGWTSSNYAALACPDFPLCQNQFFPPANFSKGFNIFQDIGPNYLGGLLDNTARTAIHLSHRIGAVLVSIAIVVLCLKLKHFSAMRSLASVLFFLLVAQVCLGISNVHFSLPLPVAVAHNGIGAMLLAFLIIIADRIHFHGKEIP